MVGYLFVYGTLRSSFTNRYARLLSQQGVLLELARVRGRLYDLGRYPALRPAQGHDEWVTGELYRLPNPEPLLKKLDAWEGSSYRRIRVQTVLVDERALPAWLYEYHRQLPAWRRIPSGDYLNP